MLITLLRWLLRVLYRFSAHNEEVLRGSGPVLLLPNHLSWWDWLFLGVCLEKDWRFATSSTTAALSWVHRRIMVNRRTFPVDMNSPYAVKHMAEYLQGGGRLVLFPEGRMSSTGSLMKLFDGTGFLIHKTRPKVITAYLRGAGRLPFSRNPNLKQWFPKVSVHFSGILTPPDPGPVGASQTRACLTAWLRDRMMEQQFETEMAFGAATLPEAIREQAHREAGTRILQDASLRKLTYRQLLVGAEALAGRWSQGAAGDKPRVGVLLPNALAMPVVLLSLWQAGKVPAVLNFTTGPAVMLSCARLAGLDRILTSRVFLERARIDIEPLRTAGIAFVYLEDVRSSVSSWQKTSAWLRVGLRLGYRRGASAQDTAVVLFTSGSEGVPKGVELTHRNLLANIRQMAAAVDLLETDRFFNALPLFHCFGLTIGLLLPLVHRVFVLLYPSPLHYRVVPSALYNLDCTVFFGTNTFLAGYARKAHPYDFRSVRYLFAGAEKVLESTSAVWMQKFGVRILEGYGATECSPCVSANVATNPRPGSAGRFLPGIEFRLEPVEGLIPAGGAARQAEGPVGRLWVRGPNIMRGYLNPEANARFLAAQGWYDTGDIARVDQDGFLYILGRLKRFAKISGEMVSLTAVEEALAGAFPQFGPKTAVAILARPHESKGEKLVAVSNEPRLSLAMIRDVLRLRGLGNLSVPRELHWLRELPLLATGKINYRELENLAPAEAPGQPGESSDG